MRSTGVSSTHCGFHRKSARTGSGRLAYEAHPSGQPMATFLSKPIAGREVVFEDLAHDFPQRVGYRSTGPGQMLAWVEGTSGGRTRRIDFAYRLVNCVAP
jgi:hypothetical protein